MSVSINHWHYESWTDDYRSMNDPNNHWEWGIVIGTSRYSFLHNSNTFTLRIIHSLSHSLTHLLTASVSHSFVRFEFRQFWWIIYKITLALQQKVSQSIANRRKKRDAKNMKLFLRHFGNCIDIRFEIAYVALQCSISVSQSGEWTDIRLIIEFYQSSSDE